MNDGPRALLIAGSSHLGKTTLARRIAERFGGTVLSTDTLARHPGRPWPEPPAAVVEFYTRLSADAVHWFLKVHHQNMWPGLRRTIEDELREDRAFVFEGSALRPEFIAPLLSPRLAGVLLHADAEFLRDRMLEQSRYATREPAAQAAIAAFIDRSLRDNADMLAAARAGNVPVIAVSDPDALDGFVTGLGGRDGSAERDAVQGRI